MESLKSIIKAYNDKISALGLTETFQVSPVPSPAPEEISDVTTVTELPDVIVLAPCGTPMVIIQSTAVQSTADQSTELS